MDSWESLCQRLSYIFDECKDLNFNIQLSPNEVDDYLSEHLLFMRVNSHVVNNIEAALFVTKDGECGFIAIGASLSTYKFLTKEFATFVVTLPDELSKHLWMKIQPNNVNVQKLAGRLGFHKVKETEQAFYYKYKGGV